MDNCLPVYSAHTPWYFFCRFPVSLKWLGISSPWEGGQNSSDSVLLNLKKWQCQSWACVIILSTCHASLRLVVLSTRNASPRCFYRFFLVSSPFRVTRHKKNLLKRRYALTARSYSSYRSNSPLPAQQSSFTPSDGQIYPFPPSGHPPPLLAAKFTPLHPAVILHPCWRSNSPLPDQRSSSPPSGSQMQLSPRSGHPPPLLVVKFTPPRPAVILHPCWRSTSPLPPAIGCWWRGETKDGRRKTGYGRRKTGGERCGKG